MVKKKILWFICALTFSFPVSAKEVHITLVQANDVYEMTPVNGGHYGGLARLQTLIKQLKRKNPNTYTLLAGDLLSPSAIGTATVNGKRLNGKQMVATFNAMGWNFMTLGNHEFDNGRESLLDNLKQAKFNVFSSNVRDAITGLPFENTSETEIFEVNGIKIGLVGITLRGLAKDFVVINDPMNTAQKIATQMKQNNHVDVLIMLTHQDLEEDIHFAEQIPEIDLILGGHEHENVYLRRGPNFTPIAKADANARSVYIHNLSYDTRKKTLTIDSHLQIIDARFKEDPAVKKVVSAWVDKAFEAFRNDGFEPEQLVAVTDVPLDGLEASVRDGDTHLTTLVAKSALSAYPGADLSLLNAGSIRIDDILPPGDVTQYDVIRILPFGGDYTKVSMPGDILEKALEAGVQNRGKGGFLHHANVEKNKSKWTVKGIPLDPNANYVVSIGSFLIERGDTGLEFLVNNPRIKKLSGDLVDSRFALINELQSTYPKTTANLSTPFVPSDYDYAN